MFAKSLWRWEKKYFLRFFVSTRLQWAMCLRITNLQWWNKNHIVLVKKNRVIYWLTLNEETCCHLKENTQLIHNDHEKGGSLHYKWKEGSNLDNSTCMPLALSSGKWSTLSINVVIIGEVQLNFRGLMSNLKKKFIK